MAAAVVAALFFVIPSFRAEIMLIDLDGNETVSKELGGWKGSSVALPGPIVEREGYNFVGWAPNGATSNEVV